MARVFALSVGKGRDESPGAQAAERDLRVRPIPRQAPRGGRSHPHARTSTSSQQRYARSRSSSARRRSPSPSSSTRATAASNKIRVEVHRRGLNERGGHLVLPEPPADVRQKDRDHQRARHRDLPVEASNATATGTLRALRKKLRRGTRTLTPYAMSPRSSRKKAIASAARRVTLAVSPVGEVTVGAEDQLRRAAAVPNRIRPGTIEIEKADARELQVFAFTGSLGIGDFTLGG